MAIREGARADGGWEEGARREGTDMGMAIFTGESSAVPPGQTPQVTFGLYPEVVALRCFVAQGLINNRSMKGFDHGICNPKPLS